MEIIVNKVLTDMTKYSIMKKMCVYIQIGEIVLYLTEQIEGEQI